MRLWLRKPKRKKFAAVTRPASALTRSPDRAAAPGDSLNRNESTIRLRQPVAPTGRDCRSFAQRGSDRRRRGVARVHGRTAHWIRDRRPGVARSGRYHRRGAGVPGIRCCIAVPNAITQHDRARAAAGADVRRCWNGYVVDVIVGALSAYIAYLMFLRDYPREAVAELDGRRAPVRALIAVGIFGIMVAGFWLTYRMQTSG